MSRATDTFRQSPCFHNCAQAVANKWSHLYPNPSTILDELSMSGSGRAEGGYCGALVAAQMALPQHKDSITAEFEKRVGHVKCREIKTLTKTPCPQCVDIADELVEKFHNA